MLRSVSVSLVLLFLPPSSAMVQESTRVGDLLRELSDDSVEVRERAAAMLVEQGAEVKRALAAARPGAGEEVRRRIDDILARIERRERIVAAVGKPTLITIEAKDRLITEVLADLKSQVSIPIELINVPEAARVTVSFSKLPFWEAIDRICKASGEVMYHLLETPVRVYGAKYRDFPKRFLGPWAVFLTMTEFQDEQPGAPVSDTRWLNFQAMIFWEKGSTPILVRSRVLDFADDQGFTFDDLKVKARSYAEERVEYIDRYEEGGGQFSAWIPIFTQLSRKATRIKRLKLSVERTFPLAWTGVTFKKPLKEGLRASCDEFEATLERAEFDRGELKLDFLCKEKVRRWAPLPETPVWVGNKDGWLYNRGGWRIDPAVGLPRYSLQLWFSKPDTDIPELRIRMPVDIHSDRFEVEFEDIPIR